MRGMVMDMSDCTHYASNDAQTRTNPYNALNIGSEQRTDDLLMQSIYRSLTNALREQFNYRPRML